MLNVWKYQNQKQVNFALDNVTVQFKMLLFVQFMVLLKMNMKLENSSYGGTDKRFHSVPFCVVLYIEKTVLPNNKI